MADYCVTGVNRKNPNDDRVSELKLWQHIKEKETGNWKWNLLGKKSADFVAELLAQKNKVFSGKEIKENGKTVRLQKGFEIEIVLRISENDENFKISDMPEF